MLASLTETQQSELAERFARDGIVRISAVLADDHSVRLHNELRARTDWVQVFNSGDKLFELSRQVQEELGHRVPRNPGHAGGRPDRVALHQGGDDGGAVGVAEDVCHTEHYA